jgi:hypothetical protein
MSEILNTEKLRQQIRELDAVRNYEAAKAQRDEALRQVELLKSKLKDHGQLQLQRDNAINNLKSSDENSIRILQEALQELSKPPEQRSKDTVGSSLLANAESLIEDLVVQRLKIVVDDNLLSIYRNQAEKQLRWILNVQWPEDLLGRKTPEKEQKLKMKLSVNPFVALHGRWDIPCEECGVGHDLVLGTIYEIKKLLVEDKTTIDAGSIHRMHKNSSQMTVFLRDAIKSYLVKKED